MNAEVNDLQVVVPASMPEARALRVFGLDQELRADREPALTCYEFAAKYQERQRLLESLGWRLNRGK